MIHRKFPVLIWKEEDQYVIRCLEPEVSSCGDTEEEALRNIKEALELYFDDKKGNGEMIMIEPHLTEVAVSV